MTRMDESETLPGREPRVRTGSVDLYAVLLLKLPEGFPGKRLGELLHELVPCDRLGAVVFSDHGDARFHRADEEAQCAPDTIGLADPRLVLSVVRHEIDALVGAVLARDVAEVALDAFLLVDLRNGLIEKVQVSEIGDAMHGPSAELFDRAKILLLHPVREPFHEVVDDPEPVVHDGGADLNARRTQQDKLRRVPPG